MVLFWMVIVYRIFRGRTLYERIKAWKAVIVNNEANIVWGDSKARYDQSHGVMDIDVEKGSLAQGLQ